MIRDAVTRATAEARVSPDDARAEVLREQVAPRALRSCLDFPVSVPIMQGADRSRQTTPEKSDSTQAQARVVSDEGCVWRITETAARFANGNTIPACLLASTEAVIRRIWDYPADWPLLSDADLLQLIHAPVDRKANRDAS